VPEVHVGAFDGDGLLAWQSALRMRTRRCSLLPAISLARSPLRRATVLGVSRPSLPALRALATRRRLAIALGLCLFAALVFSLRERNDAAASPHTPGSDQEILERLPSGSSDPRARELTQLRQRLASSPNDTPLAVEVARRNIEESRARSDPRYLGYAQAALAPWWSLPSPPPPVLLLRATIRQSTHDFDGALGDLDLVLAQTPYDAQAWITRSVVEAVRGDYDDAKASCAHLTRLASNLVTTVCYTSIESLTGDAKGAYARLAAAIDARSPRERMSPLDTEWAISTLAEIAARGGDAPEAERRFDEALALDPTDTYALAAWSDLLLDQGRASEVATRLAGRETNDGLLLRLALAEAAIKGSAMGRKADEDRRLLRARFDASHARGDVVHRREEARFVLGLEQSAARALELAKANWNVQREPWDVRIYLEAAAAARDPIAARPVLEWLDRTHLEDPAIAKLAASLRGAPR
jgi:tetratricopeptide (TPR) repeat protein